MNGDQLDSFKIQIVHYRPSARQPRPSYWLAMNKSGLALKWTPFPQIA